MKIEKRQEGFFIDGEKVKFAHFRLVFDEAVSPRGGATVAYFGDKDNVELAGIAYCSSDDNFNYAYGRQKAVGRLAQGMVRGLASDDLEELEIYIPKFLTNVKRTDLIDAMEALGYSRY